MFSRRTRSKDSVSETIDWAARAIPLLAADEQGYTGLAHIRQAGRIAHANLAYMRAKAARQDGRIIGYHGTTSESAASILQNGIQTGGMKMTSLEYLLGMR